MINEINWGLMHSTFINAHPFNHIVIDNFLKDEVAAEVVKEFPTYEDPVWSAHWKNAIENKKGLSHWDRFGPSTYRVFHYLFSNSMIENMKLLSGENDIVPDVGLHGGGLHAHTHSGNLNIHLDYSIHPKLLLQRKFNIILYLTPDWQSTWGGGLELWSHNAKTNTADALVTTVENKFNRAVIFDTTQNSWHGLPGKLSCPDNVARQSFALYYMTTPKIDADTRGKALFVPTKEQENDESVKNLIQSRSNTLTAASVWRS